MLSIIGNSPSSGSNLLAQLLDSTKDSACGVELNLFSNKKVYAFDTFRTNIRSSSAASGIHRIRNRINFHRLHSYGLNEKELRALIADAKDLRDFRDKFARRFLVLRGKNENGIVFEKTPENINCLTEFTGHFPDSYFIHLVRNPLFIYPSLLKRGFPAFISLLAWLIDVAKYIKYKDRIGVLLVKYEDLVKAPFRITKDILRTTANLTDISEGDIETGYGHNKYRELFSPKHKTWNVNTYGPVRDANITPFSNEQLMNLAALLDLKITAAYAKHFDIAEISFMDAIKEFGYQEEVLTRLGEFRDKAKMPRKSIEDRARLILKWEEDLRHGEAHLFQLYNYLNPVEKI